MTGLEVLAPGPLTTVQDLGRPGWAAMGVGRSGACDRPALRLANRLVGNDEHAAALELTLGGLTCRFTRRTWVALTGARCPVTVEGRAREPFAPVLVPAGARLNVGMPEHGLRSYLAVRGGLVVPAVLGSRSTDLLTGLGPAPLAAGQVLPVGDEPPEPVPAVEVVAAPGPVETPVLDVMRGPRADWFVPEALQRLCDGQYEVSADSNRIGVRLVGPQLARAREEELASEVMLPGGVQVPPSGQPLVFLADHPVTGGYPVLAVVRERSLATLAQLRPGQRLRFGLT